MRARRPIRFGFAPLYNSFSEVVRAAEILPDARGVYIAGKASQETGAGILAGPDFPSQDDQPFASAYSG